MQQAKAMIIHQVQFLNKSIELLEGEIDSLDKGSDIRWERTVILNERKESRRFLIQVAEAMQGKQDSVKDVLTR